MKIAKQILNVLKNNRIKILYKTIILAQKNPHKNILNLFLQERMILILREKIQKVTEASHKLNTLNMRSFQKFFIKCCEQLDKINEKITKNI